jgi:diguanylate cyclase (GGDEF)-like protein
VAFLDRVKARVLLPIFLITIVTTLFSTGWLYYIQRENLLKRTSRETALVSEVVKASIREQMLTKHRDVIQKSISLIRERTGLKEITVVNKEGEVTFSSARGLVGSSISRSDPTCIICHGSNVSPLERTVVVEEGNGNRFFRSVNPIEKGKDCQSCHSGDGRVLGILIVDQHIDRAMLDIEKTRQSLFAISLASLFILLCLIFLVIEVGVERPIRTLIKGVKGVGEGNLNLQINTRFRGEIQEFADSFNSMAERIRENVGEIHDKNLELTTLHTMVERITRRATLGEMRKIILHMMLETIEDLEYALIMLRFANFEKIELYVQRKGEATVLSRSFDHKEVTEYREFINPDYVSNWVEGSLKETSISDGGAGMIVPLAVEENQIGILYVKKKDRCQLKTIEKNVIPHMAGFLSIAIENARLYTAGIMDDVTKVHTLSYFQQVLEEEVGRYKQYGEKISLLLLDIDDFKKVEEYHGKLKSEKTLIEFARLVKDSLREVDIVCRYEGDRIAVILPEIDGKAAMIVAERIRGRTERKGFFIDNEEVKIAVSCGVAACPSDSDTAGGMVSFAEGVLRKAREKG